MDGGFKKLFLDVINGWPLGIAIILEEIYFSRVLNSNETCPK